MIHRYFLATGIMTLERLTPVIDALFGGFNLNAEPPDSASVPAFPTWSYVLTQLRELVRQLAIDPPHGALDDMRSVLLLLATHFGCLDDPAIVHLIETHRFERDADLDTLYVFANRFDDGHGLKVIKFNAGPYQGDLAHSAAHLANEMLDLLTDVLPSVIDREALAQIRKRLATILGDRGEVIDPLPAPEKPH